MIEYKNIFLKYNNKIIFSDFSLKIERFEKVIITGKSGTGKTSLFNLLLGFIKPDKGLITFDKKQVNEKTIWEIRKQIAYVDQDVFIPDLNVEQFIKLVFSYKANAKIFDLNELLNLFNFFELDYKSIILKQISQLSGGERQRIAIIIAILLKRKIFLLDEATSALDQNLKEKVANFFLKKDDYTVIAISHDPQWIENPNCRIITLDKIKNNFILED